jgi:CRP/FNR family transcriptional regulator, cyclic AMP receptor protein
LAQRKSPQPFDTRDLRVHISNVEGPTTYREGQLIFAQGDAADAAFYIEKGKVTLTVVSEQGKEAVIAILAAGDFCGEGCLAGQQVRMTTAVATEESDIVRVEKARMVEMIHKKTEFTEQLLA